MTSTQRLAYRAGQILGVPGGLRVLITSSPVTSEELTSGGELLTVGRPVPCGAADAHPSGDLRPGDRLSDPDTGLEVRCIRGGRGPLVHGGRTMVCR